LFKFQNQISIKVTNSNQQIAKPLAASSEAACFDAILKKFILRNKHLKLKAHITNDFWLATEKNKIFLNGTNCV